MDHWCLRLDLELLLLVVHLLCRVQNGIRLRENPQDLVHGLFQAGQTLTLDLEFLTGALDSSIMSHISRGSWAIQLSTSSAVAGRDVGMALALARDL